jgi:ADP-ribose pyrophosphatase YjhB (NUDIX family)
MKNLLETAEILHGHVADDIPARPVTHAFYGDNTRLLVAVDCVIFGFEEDHLELLLFKRKVDPFSDDWSLIGSFVKEDEDIRESASRVIMESTGLANIYLEQLFTFGRVTRDPGGRVISIVYYAMIPKLKYHLSELSNYRPKWFPINDAPDLVLDHNAMVDTARKVLIEKSRHFPIGAELLPKKFTLQQIFQLYQAIHNKQLDDRNFRKKISSLKILKRLNEKDMSTSRKGSYLYSFKPSVYNRYLKEGFDFKL